MSPACPTSFLRAELIILCMCLVGRACCYSTSDTSSCRGRCSVAFRRVRFHVCVSANTLECHLQVSLRSELAFSEYSHVLERLRVWIESLSRIRLSFVLMSRVD